MDLSLNNTTIIIAFLLPGVIAMWGVSSFSKTVRTWLATAPATGTSLGGAILFLVMSITAGLVADSLRSHTIDVVHFHTGIEQPTLSFEDFDQVKLDMFQAIMDNHFRYHQFYGNVFLCILFAYIAQQFTRRSWPWPPSCREFGTLVLLVVTWLGSRGDLESACLAIEELMK